MRKKRKGSFKKKSRPVGYFGKKKARKQTYAAAKSSRKGKRRRSSSYGTGAVATAVGVGATAVATVATIGMFSKTTMLENDALSKKVGISAATPAGLMFWGAGHALKRHHPVAEAGFKGVGVGLVVTDLARVLLEKFGLIAKVGAPASESRDPAQPSKPVGLPTPEEVQARRENDAHATQRNDRRENARRDTPQGGQDSPRVRPASSREVDEAASRQAEGSDNRIGSLFSLRRRNAA